MIDDIDDLHQSANVFGMACTKQHTTVVYHLLEPNVLWVIPWNLQNPLCLRQPHCEDVATVDTMYDKYDIPYDTIWPLALQKGLDLACDGVSAIYLGNIHWTSSYSSWSKPGLTLSTLMARHTFRWQLRVAPKNHTKRAATWIGLPDSMNRISILKVECCSIPQPQADD